jgi:hypothetical protein
MVVAVGSAHAPVPDFRYVGLEPPRVGQVGVAATALGLGAAVTLAMSSLDARHAVVAGSVASLLSGLALRSAGAGARRAPSPSGSARMAIVPWGVLVEDDSPRILRWAAVRKIDVVTTRLSSRVAVETEHDRFVGEAIGAVPLDRLVMHLDAYAEEQSTPLALDLDGERSTEPFESACEAVLGAARSFLETACAAADLDLPPAGYRRLSLHATGPRTADTLRRVLGDRTPKRADPRAFAAVLAAELGATELVPDLVALTQCPHPAVAAVARQAARRLGASRARTGTLDEVAAFLWDRDRERLEAWGNAHASRRLDCVARH